MSKEQGAVGKTANAVFHAVAIKNIIKAFMQGGWSAAAFQALKHYWPQILAVALILILLPVIIVCCLPMMLFGFDSSSDSQVLEMTSQSANITEYFEKYDYYCNECLKGLADNALTYQRVGYEIVYEGDCMPKNRFIAIFSVSVENNLTGVTEQQIIDFINNCITCEIENSEDENYGLFRGRVTIKCMTAQEAMENMNFTESDINWANLMFKTLEGEETDGNNSTYTN